MIRALIFDFDGLIVDTEEPTFVCWQETFREHGHELPLAQYSDRLGRPPGSRDPLVWLQAKVSYQLDRDAILARYRARHREWIDRTEPRPGVLAWVDSARERGLGLAIASSSPRSWVVGELERLRISDRFDHIRCRDDVAEGKPSPDVYLSALSALDVAAGAALAIEDSPHGITAARSAGIRCLAVPNGITATLDTSHADYRLDSFTDAALDDILTRLDR
ncbi:MAG: HAD family hydrolase [Chloroflexota bacterium]|nr:MAG: HAD family hydrolase [Chloroflexota bacterium]